MQKEEVQVGGGIQTEEQVTTRLRFNNVGLSPQTFNVRYCTQILLEDSTQLTCERRTGTATPTEDVTFYDGTHRSPSGLNAASITSLLL